MKSLRANCGDKKLYRLDMVINDNTVRNKDTRMFARIPF